MHRVVKMLQQRDAEGDQQMPREQGRNWKQPDKRVVSAQVK
jgi:hypothetical protein